MALRAPLRALAWLQRGNPLAGVFITRWQGGAHAVRRPFFRLLGGEAAGGQRPLIAMMATSSAKGAG